MKQKTNICIIGLASGYTKSVAKDLADLLDMFYMDIGDLLRYDINVDEAQKKIGASYLVREETKRINMVADYENTVITVDYAALNQQVNIGHLKRGAIIVYLNLDPEQFVNKLGYDVLTPAQIKLERQNYADRNFICSNICDIKLNCKELEDNDVVKLIVLSIKKFFESNKPIKK